MLSVDLADGELVEDDVELGLAILDLTLEVADDAVAAADGVEGADVGLEDDGTHGLFLLEGVEVLDDLGDVADAEELVGVQELALPVVGEVWGKNAVRGALPALVFAGGAGLGGGGGRRGGGRRRVGSAVVVGAAAAH